MIDSRNPAARTNAAAAAKNKSAQVCNADRRRGLTTGEAPVFSGTVADGPPGNAAPGGEASGDLSDAGRNCLQTRSHPAHFTLRPFGPISCGSTT